MKYPEIFFFGVKMTKCYSTYFTSIDNYLTFSPFFQKIYAPKITNIIRQYLDHPLTTMMVDLFSPPQQLHHCEKDHLRKWSELSHDQPDVNHLDIGGGWQLAHDGDEDGCHHQHCGQVHCDRCLKVETPEECGSVGDEDEEDGG